MRPEASAIGIMITNAIIGPGRKSCCAPSSAALKKALSTEVLYAQTTTATIAMEKVVASIRFPIRAFASIEQERGMMRRELRRYATRALSARQYGKPRASRS